MQCAEKFTISVFAFHKLSPFGTNKPSYVKKFEFYIWNSLNFIFEIWAQSHLGMKKKLYNLGTRLNRRKACSYFKC